MQQYTIKRFLHIILVAMTTSDAAKLTWIEEGVGSTSTEKEPLGNY